MTMVEKIARDMQASKAWPTVFAAGSAEVLALAALKAMREPSAAMIDAAGSTDGMKGVSDMVVNYQIRTGYRMKWDVPPFTQGWQAAIDAAIAEHEGRE